MTLLTEKDLEESVRSIREIEIRCKEHTGMTTYELGCRAFGTNPLPLATRNELKVACVPITAGIGILGDFCSILADTIEQLAGARAFVTDGTDVTGFEEAHMRGADIVFMADDDTFVAYNTRTNALSDNSDATGRVFAAFLDCASGGIDDDVLILGTGKVGIGAYRYLTERCMAVKWHDVKPGAPDCFDPEAREPRWNERAWKYIIDATTAPELIDDRHVTAESIVSAPGVPFGVTNAAIGKARLVMHDNLDLGVMAMFCQASGSLGEGAR